MRALRAKTTKHLAYQPTASHVGNIIQYSHIKGDTPTNDNEQIAILLTKIQEQSKGIPDVIDGYGSHHAIFMTKTSLLARLRTTIDFLQCSKFSALPYQCFDLKVDLDEKRRQVPVFYIKKRMQPGAFEEQSLRALVTLIEQPNFVRQQAKTLLQEKGFCLPEDAEIADKILDAIKKYLTTKKYLKSARISNLSPAALSACNIKFNKIIDKIIEKPFSTQSLDFKAKSLLQKKLSYIATIAYFLAFTGFLVEGLTEAQAREIEALLETVADKAIKDTFDIINEQRLTLNVRKELSTFLKGLTEDIHRISGGDGIKIQQAIVHAERYHTAELNARRCLVSETNFFVNQKGVKADFYVEYPLNIELTPRLKDEYIKIHSFCPEWFNVLPLCAQTWLKRMVPKTKDGDWDYFQSLHFPSTMQNLPGMKNARDCYSVLAIDNDTYKIYSKSTKGGTLTPIEIGGEREKIAAVNVEQLLSHLARQGKEAFYSFWGGKDRLSFHNVDGKLEQVKPVIFIHSLLSKIKGLDKVPGVDNHMINVQDDAVDIISSRSEFMDVNVIRGIDPANGFQGLSYRSEYWEHTTLLFRNAEKLLYALGLGENKQWDQRWWDQVISALDNGNPDLLFDNPILGKPNSLAYLADLNEEQKEEITKIVLAIKRLRELRTIDWVTENDERNYRAYKSLYQGLLVEAMKGLVYSSCKSGKDRTGKDAKYRKAANIHFLQFGRIPSYSDKGRFREHFVDVIEELTYSKIFDVSAGRNSPGSDGIKERQQQTAILTAIKTGKLVQLAFSAIGLIAGIGLCFVAPLLGVGIMCGSLGIATLGLQSFNKTPVNQQKALFILASVVAVAGVLAGVGIVAAAAATGGIALAAGACFLGFVASSILFAGATLAYGKWAKLRRGVTDEDITARARKAYKVSLEQSALNKPHLLSPCTKNSALRAGYFKIDSATSPIEMAYTNWKLQCSAYLVRDEALVQEWDRMALLINKHEKTKDDFDELKTTFARLMIYVLNHGRNGDIDHFQAFERHLKSVANNHSMAGKGSMLQRSGLFSAVDLNRSQPKNGGKAKFNKNNGSRSRMSLSN